MSASLHSKDCHVPVLREEAIQALNISSSSLIVDATYGRGGHTRMAVAKLGNGGRLLAIDRDLTAVARGRDEWSDDARVEIVHASFSELQSILEERSLMGQVTGLLFDFGVSSPQLDNPARGFSFMQDGPLDMRMDTTQGMSAAEWLHQVDEKELMWVLKKFGEERFARKIAAKIKQQGLIHSTGELADLISSIVYKREPGKHPATRSFQAIRIAVNNELGEIESVLPQAVASLNTGGRLVVISFHSLEDRIVKRFLRDQSKGDPYPPDLPVTADMLSPVVNLIGKPIRAGQGELDLNRRARSAVMRVAEKVA